MIFNTWDFFLFFVLVAALYWTVSHRKQNILLLLASYFFYSMWDWRFLSLVLATTICDYLCAIKIREKPKEPSKVFLWFNICFNLGILGYLKYCNFFIDNLHVLLSNCGIQFLDSVHLNLILPLGISFYTFQSISYVVDVYLGLIPPCRNFLQYALFVSFFPKVSSGPIERADNLLSQIQKPRVMSVKKFDVSCYLIFLGLFKKLFVADNLARLASGFWQTQNSMHGFEVMLVSWVLLFQVYADFSGYTDLARGTAGLFGFNLLKNFNLPFFSKNPSEIWRRWHISLCEWVRDYVFLSLGGMRAKGLRLMAILLTTMIIIGVWHGAQWSYFLWGLYHGILLCIYVLIKPFLPRRKKNQKLKGLKTCLSIFLIFNLLAFSELIFMAPQLSHIVTYFKRLFVITQFSDQFSLIASQFIFYGGILWVYELFQFIKKDPLFILKSKRPLLILFYAVGFYLIIFFGASGRQEFIYFQF